MPRDDHAVKPIARVVAALAIALSSLMCAQAVFAQAAATSSGQTYPAKPIRIVVPFTPGGPNDILARMMGQKLTESWGQQVIIDNRPGGGTVIGTEAVAHSAPDGYTLLMVSTSQAVNPSLRPKLPFDTLKDFSPLIQLVNSPNVLVTHPSVPVRTVRDLINLAKARPGQIAYASGGTGAATHLAGELLQSMAKVEFIHVPYRGASPATVDLISGQVSFMFGTIQPTLPHIKAGKLRAIAVSGLKRVPILPAVPPVAETLPGFDADSWYGIFVPAGTPAPVIAKLNAEMGRILHTPEIAERLRREGTEPVGGSPEQFGKLFRSAVVTWGKVIREAGIRLD